MSQLIEQAYPFVLTISENMSLTEDQSGDLALYLVEVADNFTALDQLVQALEERAKALHLCPCDDPAISEFSPDTLYCTDTEYIDVSIDFEKALARIRPDAAQVLRMRVFDGKRPCVIAEELDLTQRQVDYLFRLARTRLCGVQRYTHLLDGYELR